MKTKIFTTIMTLLAVIFSLTLQASGYYFEDEALIDDIPFNTEMIYNQMMAQNKIPNFYFKDEPLIDDIPFDTHKIVANYKYHQAMNKKFSFTDEPLIDDIPFDTQKIVENYKYHQALNQKFNFADEPLIDDIPFNTNSIVMHLKENKEWRPFVVAFISKHLY